MHRGGDEATAVNELRIAYLIDRDDWGVAKKSSEADLVAYLGARYRNLSLIHISEPTRPY